MPQTIERIRSEFLEMPGLRLTSEQIHRLCGVERGACAEILGVLVRDRFLRMNPDGTYTRLSEDHHASPFSPSPLA
jgi:hypothetical protein